MTDAVDTPRGSAPLGRPVRDRHQVPLRLIWVFEHANPYNIYLVNQLNRRMSVEHEAYYVREHLPSHPWKLLPERDFEWREYEFPGRLGAGLLSRIIRDRRAFFLFNGWRDNTMRFGMWLCRAANRPYALWTDTPRRVETWTPFERTRRRVVQSFAAGAVAVLGTGSPALERFAELGIDRAKMHALPWIIDLDHFGRANGRRTGSRAADLTLLQIGRLVSAVKGQSVVLRALERIAATDADLVIELVVAGTGPDEEELRRQSAEAGLSERVSFIGWVGYDELPEVLARADVLVQPSFYDPYPVAVIEALAAGLPVLGSTACGSVRELVGPAVCGYQHAPGDAEMLASQIRSLARDRSQVSKLARNARAAVEPWGVGYADRLLQEVCGLS
jgi:glycosyltransferase involved in cell wall biosynthesis